MYRFGSNGNQGGEVGDYTGVSDGLEMKEPDDGFLTGNNLMIQVNPKTPTIEFLVNKDAGIPWFLIRDGSEGKAVTIDRSGVHCVPILETLMLLTPGTHFAENTLREGYQVHRFEFNTAWQNNITESSIELRGVHPQATGTFHQIENLEVCLDDLSQLTGSSEIASRIYIKRWSVYRNLHSRLYVVLAVDFRNNETNLSQYSLIRLSFNFKTILES